MTIEKISGNIYKLSRRTGEKTDLKNFLKKVKKSLKKRLTSGVRLWYDIQAVAASGGTKL